MEDGLLSLKWNNHKSTFFHILREVRGKQTYTDATLACEGKFYSVHKLVMSTCSDYFAEIFEKTPCKNPVVVLKDIKKSDLDALLDYMYIGEVDVRQSELAGLIKAAECLRIKGLAVPDEDPTKGQKKGPSNVPERREDSPPAKRKRRDSGERGRSHHSPVPRGSTQSSSSTSSSHHLSSTSSSVPSHAPTQQSSVPESLVPSQSMLPPVGSSHQDSRHGDNLRGRQESQSHSRPPPDPSSLRLTESSQASAASQKSSEASILPVDMIKVEVDEGTDNRSKEVRPEKGEDAGGGDQGGGDEEETSNDFTDYQSHGGEIEKEEHDQMDYGADQLPGPSGLQGGPSMLGWGDEGEGGFPHNLFSTEDPSSQQAALNVEKPYACPLCSYATYRRDHLNTHVRKHTGEKPFSCPHCPYKASQQVHLNLHVRTHTGERPYSCSQCPYKAAQKAHLLYHLRTHTGEKPYQCQFCPYASAQSSHLKQHVRAIHLRKLQAETKVQQVPDTVTSAQNPT